MKPDHPELLKRYLRAVTERDRYSAKERDIEDEVFSRTEQFTNETIALTLRRYEDVKRRRLNSSLEVARLHMTMTPKDRQIAVAIWVETSEGKRKRRRNGGSGVRGK